MTYRKVNAAAVESGRGPHPAASPFDKRIGEALGLRTFEVYQVELPAGEQTVLHDHAADGAEDAYAVISGDGWVEVDGDSIPVRPGDFVAVDLDSNRRVRAGSGGLVFIAVCTATG